MPSREQLVLVGSTCSEYEPVFAIVSGEIDEEISCDTCRHWAGEEEKCELDIFENQLTNLDQT